MKIPFTLGALVAAANLALLGGCQSQPAPVAPQETTKYTVENTEKFVLLDEPTRASVSCTGLQERALADGRLEVVAIVKNHEDRRVPVQVQCVFKDEQGFSTGDETAWETLVLPENSTETVKFTASNTAAKRYTIRMRQPK